MILRLNLKTQYWNEIQSGEKTEEYRLVTDYWKKRLVGRDYSAIHIWLGYPPKHDLSRLIARRFNGFNIKTITHPHFGSKPVEVFAIDVSRKL